MQVLCTHQILCFKHLQQAIEAHYRMSRLLKRSGEQGAGFITRLQHDTNLIMLSSPAHISVWRHNDTYYFQKIGGAEARV